LDASKLVFFENCLVLPTPPIYLNDPWDFLPKGRLPSEDEILKVWCEIETDISRASIISLPVGFAQREQQGRLEKMRHQRLVDYRVWQEFGSKLCSGKRLDVTRSSVDFIGLLHFQEAKESDTTSFRNSAGRWYINRRARN